MKLFRKPITPVSVWISSLSDSWSFLIFYSQLQQWSVLNSFQLWCASLIGFLSLAMAAEAHVYCTKQSWRNQNQPKAMLHHPEGALLCLCWGTFRILSKKFVSLAWWMALNNNNSLSCCCYGEKGRKEMWIRGLSLQLGVKHSVLVAQFAQK